MDWSDPAQRAALIERVGPDEYNKQHEAHRRASVIETVNGYPLRYANTRFGQLVQIDGANVAFHTLDEARQHAAGLPPGKS